MVVVAQREVQGAPGPAVPVPARQTAGAQQPRNLPQRADSLGFIPDLMSWNGLSALQPSTGSDRVSDPIWTDALAGLVSPDSHATRGLSIQPLDRYDNNILSGQLSRQVAIVRNALEAWA